MQGAPKKSAAAAAPTVSKGPASGPDLSHWMDLLRTHPRLLMGGLLLENPHHIPSDDFTAA